MLFINVMCCTLVPISQGRTHIWDWFRETFPVKMSEWYFFPMATE